MSQELVKERVLKYLIEDLFVPQDMIDTNVSLNEFEEGAEGILSPGEKSRVALAKLSMSGANLLLLDEPTNHLDPETQYLIAEVFKDYQGTMIVVSHNPDFVDNLGIERTLILPTGEISYYNRETVERYKVLNKQRRK